MAKIPTEAILIVRKYQERYSYKQTPPYQADVFFLYFANGEDSIGSVPGSRWEGDIAYLLGLKFCCSK